MSWRQKGTLGLEMVAWIHDMLRIEDQWVYDEADGFTWWGESFAQRVWSDLGVYHNGMSVYKLHAEADVVRGRGRSANLDVEFVRAAASCPLSAAVYDSKEDTYKLHTSAYVCEENLPWLRKLFSAAVGLQLAEANAIGRDLATRLNAARAVSEHPRTGMRTTGHPMVRSADGFFRPQGAQPCRWVDSPEWDDVYHVMDREASAIRTDKRSRAEASFPWESTGEGDLTLRIDTDVPNPRLGNGLSFLLTTPLTATEEQTARLALEMNRVESKEWGRSHFLGGWGMDEGRLAFRCFVPNTAFHSDLLPMLAMSMAVRACWVDEFFLAKKQGAQKPHGAQLI